MERLNPEEPRCVATSGYGACMMGKGKGGIPYKTKKRRGRETGTLRSAMRKFSGTSFCVVNPGPSDPARVGDSKVMVAHCTFVCVATTPYMTAVEPVCGGASRSSQG